MNPNLTGFSRLVNRIRDLQAENEQLRRRLNNMVREGRVVEVNAADKTCRIDANGLISAKVPWPQRAGKFREWLPPTVGERVVMLSPTGEPGQGHVLWGGFSDQFQAPSQRDDEFLRVSDNTTVRQRDDLIEVIRGEQVVEMQENPERMRVHFGGIPEVVLRPKRLQMKLKPNPNAPAIFYILMDLEPLRFWMSHAPDIVPTDPYPED